MGDMMRRRIGINLSIIGSKQNSFSYYARNIVPRLTEANDVDEFVIFGGRTLEWGNSEVKKLSYLTGAGEGLKAQVGRFIWQNWGMKINERSLKLDTWYSPTHHGKIGAGIDQVITVHDLIPLRFPNQNPLQTQYFRNVLPKVLKASRAVITVSQATKRDLVNFYNINVEKIKVVHLGHTVNIKEVTSKGVKNFILVPGAGYPHKNAVSVIKAFAALENDIKNEFRLVITGAGKMQELLSTTAAECGVIDRCDIYGFLSSEEMEAVWEKTALLLYASLWEGFGIPPLEAMSRGIPCIVSNIASLPEVCGEAVVYVDPYKLNEITEAMAIIIRKPTMIEQLINIGYQRVKIFNWDQAAEGVYNCIRVQ